MVKGIGLSHKPGKNNGPNKVKEDTDGQDFCGCPKTKFFVVNRAGHVHHVGSSKFGIHIDNHDQGPAKHKSIEKFT